MTKETTKPFISWCEENGISIIKDDTERKFIESICERSMTPDECILNLYCVSELKELAITTDEYSRLYDEWEEILQAYDAYVDSMISNHYSDGFDDQDPMYV